MPRVDVKSIGDGDTAGRGCWSRCASSRRRRRSSCTRRCPRRSSAASWSPRCRRRSCRRSRRWDPARGCRCCWCRAPDRSSASPRSWSASRRRCARRRRPRCPPTAGTAPRVAQDGEIASAATRPEKLPVPLAPPRVVLRGPEAGPRGPVRLGAIRDTRCRGTPSTSVPPRSRPRGSRACRESLLV